MAASVVYWSSLWGWYSYTLSLYDAVYNPNGQVLYFDYPLISASNLYIEAYEYDTLTVIAITDFTSYKTVYFYVDALTITTSNICFANGSLLLVGDNSYLTYNDSSGNTLTGGSGNDRLIGLAGNDRLVGGDGWDVFSDAFGSNTLFGGAGDDGFYVYSAVGSSNTVSGGTGSDFYYLDNYSPALVAAPAVAGHNYVVTDFTPGPGGDAIYLSDLGYIAFGYTGQEPFAAGYLRLLQSGSNTLIQADRDGSAGSTYGWMTLITLQNVQAGSLTPDNFPGLGTSSDDLLTGTERPDLMTGLDGNDTLDGQGGNDSLNGGGGNDILNGGTGTDAMSGGDGSDTYYVDDTGDQVTETPRSTGADIDTVVASVDFVLGTYLENLELAGAAAAGTGNSLDNILAGNSGNNTLSGLAGNDTLEGGSGIDTAVFTGSRAGYTITRTSTGYTVAGGSDGTDTLTSIEHLQFAGQTLDLTPLSDYGTRLQVFATAWLDRLLTPEKLIPFAADYVAVAASGGTIYDSDLYDYLSARADFLNNPNKDDVIRDMYERLTGTRDVPQDMYNLFMERMGVNWGADKLAVKMIKSAGFWVFPDGSFGKPPAFPFDFTAGAADDLPALQAQLADDLPYVIPDAADDALVLVGVAG